LLIHVVVAVPTLILGCYGATLLVLRSGYGLAVALIVVSRGVFVIIRLPGDRELLVI